MNAQRATVLVLLLAAAAVSLTACKRAPSAISSEEFADRYNSLLSQAYPESNTEGWEVWHASNDQMMALSERWSNDWLDADLPVSQAPSQILDVTRLEPWPCDELEEAVRLLDEVDAEGIFHPLDSVSVAQLTPEPWPADVPVLDHFGSSSMTGASRRSLARVIALRMRLAAAEGDADRLVAEARRGHAVAAPSGILLIDDILADGVCQVMWNELRSLAGDGTLPPSSVRPLLADVKARQDVPLAIILEADALFGQATGADTFEGIDKPRSWSGASQRAYREAIDRILVDRPSTLAEVGAHDFQFMLDTVVISPEDSTKADWIALGSTTVKIAVRNDLLYQFAKGSTELVLAVEAFRSENGTPPTALGDLVPAFFDRVPIDVSWGGSFKYELDPTAAGGYVLYSYGIDGTDNGGIQAEPGAGGLMSMPIEARGYDVQLRPARIITESFDD